MLFCSARQGTVPGTPTCWGPTEPLFETILSYIPAPEAEADKPLPDAGLLH